MRGAPARAPHKGGSQSRPVARGAHNRMATLTPATTPKKPATAAFPAHPGPLDQTTTCRHVATIAPGSATTVCQLCVPTGEIVALKTRAANIPLA